MSDVIDWSKAPADATHCWEAAQDFFKLDHGQWMVWYAQEKGWYKSAIKDRWTCLVKRPQPAPWSGEGLPPVGTVCEVRCIGGGWGAATIKYISPTQCVWLWVSDNEDQAEFAREPWNMEFRPVRTPEQIAAELADQAIKEIAGIICRDGAFDIDDPEVTESAVALYDAGYRKQ